jgi:hypothetical protein
MKEFMQEISTLDGTFSAFPNPTSGAFEIKYQQQRSCSIFFTRKVN